MPTHDELNILPTRTLNRTHPESRGSRHSSAHLLETVVGGGALRRPRQREGAGSGVRWRLRERLRRHCRRRHERQRVQRLGLARVAGRRQRYKARDVRACGAARALLACGCGGGRALARRSQARLKSWPLALTLAWR